MVVECWLCVIFCYFLWFNLFIKFCCWFVIVCGFGKVVSILCSCVLNNGKCWDWNLVRCWFVIMWLVLIWLIGKCLVVCLWIGVLVMCLVLMVWVWWLWLWMMWCVICWVVVLFIIRCLVSMGVLWNIYWLWLVCCWWCLICLILKWWWVFCVWCWLYGRCLRRCCVVWWGKFLWVV